MKKCKSIEKFIQKFLDQTISPDEEKELIKHTQECQKCKKELEVYMSIFSKFKKITYQPLPDNFEQRLHYKLIDYIYKKQKSLLYPKLLPTAIVATIILAVVISSVTVWKIVQKNIYYPSVFFYSAEESYKLASIESSNYLPLYSRGNLRIKLKTDKEIKNVEVLINIPAQLSIDGKQKVVKWRGDLKPGENYLILTVVGQSSGEFPINISIKQNSKKKTINTFLKIT